MYFVSMQRYWYPQVDLLLEMGRGKEHKASPPVVHTNVAFNLPHHECHRLVRHDFSPAPSHRSIRPVANTQSTATGSTASNKPADRYEIAVFDSRGFGKSGDTFFSRYSSRNMARDILAFLEHLGWVKSTWPGASEEDRQKLPVLHLVGWSMGGTITTLDDLVMTSRLTFACLVFAHSRYDSARVSPSTCSQSLQSSTQIDFQCVCQHNTGWSAMDAP